jgi:hypothetical protein
MNFAESSETIQQLYGQLPRCLPIELIGAVNAPDRTSLTLILQLRGFAGFNTSLATCGNAYRLERACLDFRRCAMAGARNIPALSALYGRSVTAQDRLTSQPRSGARLWPRATPVELVHRCISPFRGGRIFRRSAARSL